MHPVGRTCDVGLDIPGVSLPDDFKKLTATLQRPRSSKEEPVNLELNPDNTLGMFYILFNTGEKIWGPFSYFDWLIQGWSSRQDFSNSITSELSTHSYVCALK